MSSALSNVYFQDTQNGSQQFLQTTRDTIRVLQTSIEQTQETLVALWQRNQDLVQTLNLKISQGLKLKCISARIQAFGEQRHHAILLAVDKEIACLRKKNAQSMQKAEPYLVHYQTTLCAEVPNDLSQQGWLLSSLKTCAIAKGTYDQCKQFDQLLQKPVLLFKELIEESKMWDSQTPGSYVSQLQNLADWPDTPVFQIAPPPGKVFKVDFPHQAPEDDSLPSLLVGQSTTLHMQYSMMFVQLQMLLNNNHLLTTKIEALTQSQKDLKRRVRSIQTSKYGYQSMLKATIDAFQRAKAEHLNHLNWLNQEYEDAYAKQSCIQAIRGKAPEVFCHFLKVFARTHEMDQRCALAEFQKKNSLETVSWITRQLHRLRINKQSFDAGF